jgi:SAM-dependent methyltransferase
MATTEDYRASHLQRGSTYDDTLAGSPFDKYMADWERQHLCRVVGELFPEAVPRYLDFACGTGRVTSTVAPMARASVGVDISGSMIEVARRKLPGTEFHLCDLTSGTPDIGRFDLVTAFRFFGNAQPELRESAMRTLAERLRPGGFLIINNHRNPRAWHVMIGRLTGGSLEGMDLRRGKLHALLKRHGLRVVREHPIGAWMFRSSVLEAYRADDPAAIANERRFSHRLWSHFAPDVVVVAQRV